MVWYRSRMMPAIEIDRHTMWWFVLIGFLDTFASTLILCAAVFISAPMATLLSQGVIPITMLSSMWFLRRRFHCNHWLGALLIVFSNGVSIVFLYLSLSGNSGVSASATESSVPTFVWAIVFFLSNFPIAGSSIAKEKLLLANMNAGLDLPTLNAWVALYQLLFSIGLAPCVFWLQHMNDSASISELPQIMWWGIKCTFFWLSPLLSSAS
jgi:drug/metabolite transporter (DMT)-like permease